MTDSIRQQIIDAINVRFNCIKTSASQIIGSDSKNYTCIYPHLSAAGNKPTTGASWTTYWSQTGSAGVAWGSGQNYSPGGYQTNLGSNINWWRDLERNPLQSSEVPGANVRDISDEPEPFVMGYDLHSLSMEIDLASTSQGEMRNILADIEKAVNVDLTWTTLALHTRIESDGSEVEHLEEKYLSSKIVMKIQYKTAMGNPYA